MRRNQQYVAAAAMGMGLMLGAFSVTAQESYKARLSALPADAKTRPDMAGGGTVTATVAGTKLSVNGTFDGLKTNATMAEIRDGGMAGVRGPVVGPLTITKAMKGTITGSADLTATQAEHFKKGGLYVQIYSEKPADGTLWGWFTK
jgi:CHRD domain